MPACPSVCDVLKKGLITPYSSDDFENTPVRLAVHNHSKFVRNQGSNALFLMRDDFKEELE
jgi:hypothetical protein